VSQLYASRLGSIGARESAFLVTEKLALEQGAGNGRAVDLDESPFPQGERRWISLARISFPVPLCPWSKTGMLAFAALSTLCRIAPITAEVPKITSSGGKSTTGATRAGFEVATHPIVFSPNRAGSY